MALFPVVVPTLGGCYESVMIVVLSRILERGRQFCLSNNYTALLNAWSSGGGKEIDRFFVLQCHTLLVIP